MTAVTAHNIEDIYPLSPLQQGMLFHSLLDADSGVYLMQDRYRIGGAIDGNAFLRAWQLVVQAHPALRTGFLWKTQKQPMQIVHQKVDVPIEEFDLREQDPAQQEAFIVDMLAQEQKRGFDLSKPPLIRFRLVRLADESYEFIRSFHHILMDAWCISLVTVDCMNAYADLVAGRTPQLPRPRPYRDYIDWLQKQDRGLAQQFWQRELAGLAAPTSLVVDQGARGEQYTTAVQVEDLTVFLDKAQTLALEQFCQTRRITPNTLFQGVWALLLSRYSGNRDVLFGVTVAGRPAELAGVEHMIGLFINTLPLRVAVDESQEVSAWLQQIQAHNLEIRQFEHTPLVDIQGWSDFPRGESLFDSILVYENAPVDEKILRGEFAVKIETMEHSVHTHYGMTAVVLPGERTGMRLSFDTRRFARDAVTRMLGHMQELLLGMLATPDAPLAAIELLTATERQVLLHDWNDSGVDFPLDQTYASLFAARVAAHPDRIAALCGADSLTYAELDRRSNRIAHALRGAGAGADTLVALMAERGLPLLTMMIAVFKAGAAYLPLDVLHPPGRLADIIDLSQAPLLLAAETSGALLDQVLSHATHRPAALVAESIWLRGEPAALAADGRPDDLAYVIFTSGSTGQPKGAMVEQRGMLNNIFGKVPTLGMGEHDRIAQTASPAFDISVWQFLAAPLVGGTVHILPDAVAHDPFMLLKAIDSASLTLIEAVPTVIRGMLDVCPPDCTLASLRWVLPTGEALPPSVCRSWFERFPSIPFMNAYGPAECSDDVAFHAIDTPPAGSMLAMPIGRPTANNHLYIVDAALRQVPIGVPGEICVAGVGVGRGYLNDPERTQAAFVPHPFTPGARFYRTGDMGRYGADGVIEFLGRRDQQVKVRGYRIELGEIESRLARHPAVNEAAVVTQSDARGETQLLAYWSRKEGQDVDAPALRDHLSQQLPHYMVPAVMVELDRLPLNPNGKVDRKALAARRADVTQAQRRHVAPRTSTEQQLAQIWIAVLAVPEVGIEDSFFSMGGHSLLATQVISRIRTGFKLELPLRAVFEYPTIAQLARAVDDALARHNSQPLLPAIAPQPRPARLPLSFAQQRLWFLEQFNPGSSLFNIPFALELTGELNADLLARSFESLLARHEVLRTGFASEGGQPWQFALPAAPFNLPVIDLRGADAQLDSHLAAFFEQAFDLGRPPLLRACLLRLNEQRTVLAVVLHHLVSDAWSATLAIRELSACYTALSNGEQPRLDALPVQYADFTLWQRAHLQGPELDRQLAYWRKTLGPVDGQPPRYVLDLPLDHARPTAQDYKSGSLALRLQPELSARLHRHAAESRQSAFSLVFAAFAALLHRFSGQNDIMIGTPASNRQRPETESMLGILLNNLVIRAKFDDRPNFAALSRRVGDALFEAQRHQDLPFEQLVDSLAVPRSLEHAPLFQVMVAQQLTMESRISMPGLTLRALDTPLSNSECELDLHVACPHDGPVDLELLYASALFEASTAQRLLAQLEQLLGEVLDQPERSIADCLAQAGNRTPRSADVPQAAPVTLAAPPRGDTEQAIAAIWAEVLRLPRERVGRHDNFFHLGGHSLLATVVLARMRERFVTVPPLRELFGNPTVAQLAPLVGDSGTPGERGIALQARPDELPLSFAQQRLWFLNQLTPGAAYNISSAIELRGHFEPARMQGALELVVARHEILRSRITEQGVLLIDGDASVSIRAESMFGSDQDWEQAMRDAAANEAQLPFDLARDRLLRARLLQREGHDQVLLMLTVHHCVADDWSVQLLIDELADAYQGRQPAPLAIQYVDYSLWQRQDAQQARHRVQLDYWRTTLVDGSYVLDLPTDRPRGAQPGEDAGACYLRLPTELVRDVRSYAASHGVTVFMLLLASLKLTLGRYAGQRDVRIGTPVANRSQLEVQGLIGCFVNTLVIRSEIDPQAPFTAFLDQVRQQVLAAQENQDVPFEQVVDALVDDRNLAQTPLFQVLFVMQNAQLNNSRWPGLELREIGSESRVAKFDLNWEVHDDGESLAVMLEYRSALFDAATMERWLAQWQHVLRQAIDGASTDLLPPAERERQLVEWNATAKTYPGPRTLVQALETQLASSPDAPALRYEGVTLSYAELHARANQLAHALRAEGVGPESIVGVCMERSLDMVIALVGIAKAGAAYLPLDPELPQARIAFMLDDAKAPLVLTQSSLADRLPGARCLDQAWLGAWPTSAPSEVNQPTDLAYVIYTSGSTGQPKGVLTEHAALMNRLHWMQDSFAIGAQDRVLQKTPYSFDVSVWEFFWPLMTGACLVVARPGGHQDSGYLAELVRQAGITTLHFVPSMLQAFVAEPALASCTSLRQVFCSGEALPYDLQQRFCQAHPARLINLYGPTEAAIDVSVWRCDPQSDLRFVPIGKPIANLQLYVLDEAMQLLPQGAIGELYIGGTGLARAYLNRPELNAERFVAHPFQPGARLYRTGDRCRFLADGSIAYLGRFDHQVKLRGLRIELGEIETQLTALADVAQAVAMVRRDQLVAYVVPAEGRTPDAAQLAQSLRTQLPSYMVPAAFVMLDRLPLTSNGKTDRKALPEPELAHGEAIIEPPRSGVELELAQLWSEVLSLPLDAIGRSSNFFHLGGQSLLATVLLARMRQRFATVPALRSLFDNPTIAALAPLVGGACTAVAASISALPRPAQLPLSFAQQRLWFLSQLAPGAAYNISSAIELRGRFDQARMQQALELVLARHEILRSRIVEQGAGAALLIDADASVSLRTEYMSGSDQDWEQAMRDAAANEAQLPFDLARDRLLRARLLQREGHDQVLLMLTVHHCVADDWSVQLLIDELADAYQGRQPAPLAIQYVDYSLWQRQDAQQARHRVQLDYWRTTLVDGSYVLDLPTDRPRGAQPGEDAGACYLRLPTELVRDVRSYAASHGVTVFMLLLASLKLTLGRYAGQRDVRIGTPVANRSQLEVQGLIGCFVNTLVIRSEIDPQAPFTAFLDQVRQQVLAAQENQDVPFEQVVDALVDDRNLAQTPLFQVLFVMQNAQLNNSRWPGLELREIGSESRVAKFDLNWEVHDDGESLAVMLEYRSALFDAATMERWLAQWQHVLRQAIDGASTDLLPPAERERQLAEWNATAKTYPGPRTLVQALETQLASSPDAPALRYEGVTLSYAELHARTNQLAHALRAEGVARESIVGVCMERSLDMVIALVGIVKAGAAYLPLDPELPQARIAFMLDDAKAPLVLTQSSLADRLPGARCLDQAWLGAWPTSAPSEVNQPTDLAYVIYTSGSTGQPKGVLTEHAALMNRLHWMQDSFAIGAQDRVLQKTPYSFDVSVWEFFWPLMTGACLVVARPGGHQDSGYLAELVRQAGITTLHFVPSMLQAFVAEPALASCTSLRQVFCSGEALPYDLQQRFCQAHPARLINLYGPTEAAIDVSVWRCDPQSDLRFVPIGKPIANLQLYVLDEAMQLLPQGAVGELYIGGAGLARAYLNRPELNAERFVAHPFQPGARLYRTGDRCRFLADGSIAYLGRFDHQVKLRGLRIELGEIETQLTALTDVAQAVAMVRRDSAAEQLVAYVVPAEGCTPKAETLAQALRTQLPSYMVPAAFVVLDRLPLTSNGKTDRKALPAPVWGEHQATFQAPVTATEITLCTLLEGLLKLKRVGTGDNFFALGGDSIVGLQFIAQARSAGIAITPRQLFQQRTVGELALVAGVATALEAEQGILTGPVPLMAIQHWFFEQDLENNVHWNQSLLLTPKTALEAALIVPTLQRLVEQHDALRLRFFHDNGAWQQQYGTAQEAFTFCERKVGSGESIAQAISQLNASVSLERGPLLQVALLRLDSSEQRLYFSAHHLLVDTVSWRILLEDFVSVYGQLAAGEPAVLPPKTTSYRQWSERLRSHQGQRAYWESQPAPVGLPIDDLKGDNRVRDQVALLEKLSPKATDDLLHKTHQAYRTQVQDLLLAALASVLSEWCGTSGITLEMEGHGRESSVADLDLSRSVGWFTTLYPVYLAAAKEDGPLISGVKEQMRAVPEHGLGYGALRYLSGDATLRNRPHSQVLFNYLGRIDGAEDTGMLALATETLPPDQDDSNQRTHELEIVAAIHQDALQIEWRFSGKRHDTGKQQQLLSNFTQRLQRLIEHCQHSSGTFTPSDFPMAKGMNQQTLNKLLSKLK